MVSWIDEELAGCKFADGRLKARFKRILTRLSDGIGRSVPLACRDWANTKAAYRFFANPRVNESDILSGHFQATGERIGHIRGPILMLQDTTEFSYKREEPQNVGFTRNSHVKRWEHRRAKIPILSSPSSMPKSADSRRDVEKLIGNSSPICRYGRGARRLKNSIGTRFVGKSKRFTKSLSPVVVQRN